MVWADILSATGQEKLLMSGSACPVTVRRSRPTPLPEAGEGPRRFWEDPKMPDLDYILLAVQLVRLLRVLLQLLTPKGRRKK